MEKKKPIRSRWLTVRLNEEEEKTVIKYFKRTTANSISEYARALLLKEPVTVLYRNQSADDFLASMLLLKTELNAIGNNFNQAVHKLHTYDHAEQLQAWAIRNEKDKQIFFNKVQEIQETLSKIHTLWSQG